ncbi:MAG: hypothetical protein LBG62_04695 [Candidatus Methanoplasma sp.]|jgi:hypothetical protein|nr:hypothetical protein [Candidatus Methanoplasma sp.]
MGKLGEAKDILRSIGMPERQCNDRSAHVLLALCHLEESDPWSSARSELIGVTEIMKTMEVNYDVVYMPNTREAVRKGSIHQFRDAGVIEDNGEATNSPNYRYALTREMLALVSSYGSSEWRGELERFLDGRETLKERYRQKRLSKRIPVNAGGASLEFGPGAHNQLQKDVIEGFAPVFAPGAILLYVGDAERKDLVRNADALERLHVKITDHDKLPDVVLYSEERGWLFFVEAVVSSGAMSKKRVDEIERMTAGSECGKIFVTAFPDRKTFKAHADELAWETEVWIADAPEHLIHLDGERFLGPYRQNRA